VSCVESFAEGIYKGVVIVTVCLRIRLTCQVGDSSFHCYV